jgi:DNA-binding NarL/FixJ family response regulator
VTPQGKWFQMRRLSHEVGTGKPGENGNNPPMNYPVPIHIALVEDDPLFRDAFASAVGSAQDMVLRIVATTRRQALAAMDQPAPDVMVVDLGLPDGSGIDVIRAAQLRWPACEIMVSTTFGDEAHVIRSIESGAKGYLLKDSAPGKMIEEIRSLRAGGSPISPLIARQVLMRLNHHEPAASVPAPLELPPSPRGGLAAREREVLVYITKGFTYEEIANLMGLSRHTVLTFVRRIYAKLEVSSKVEAIYEARKQGLLED